VAPSADHGSLLKASKGGTTTAPQGMTRMKKFAKKEVFVAGNFF